MTKRGKKTLIISLLSLLVLVIVFLGIYIPYHKKAKAPTREDSSVQRVENTTTEQGKINSNTTDSATIFYSNGLEDFNAKQYQSAIDNFNQAIGIDPQNDVYYSKKSQAEMNLGDKASALITLKAGLSEIPDSDLLKSQMDVLQSQLGNQDGVKQ